MLAANEAEISDRASKLVTEDDKSGDTVVTLASCDTESIAELSANDSRTDGEFSTRELIVSR